MIILKGVNEKIRIKLNLTVTTDQLQCVASYRNRTNTTFDADSNYVLTNNTTYVDLVGSPVISSQRIIDYISVYNNDTTQKTVTIEYFDGVNLFILFNSNIGIGEKIEYVEGSGWKVLTSIGSVKMSINQGTSAPNPTGLLSVILPSDVVNNNAIANSISDVTGLNVSLTGGKVYYFKFVIWYTAQATTTGSRWAVNANVGTATNLTFISEYSLTGTTSTRNASVIGFDLPATANATSASLTSNLSMMEGYFIPTEDCIFTARFSSEVANSAITAKAGSVLYYQQLT